MRNILFYYDNFCSDSARGGTEVATFRIAKALKDSGQCKVFHAFRSKSDGKNKSIYTDVIKLGKSRRSFEYKLSEFIKRNDIEVVVNMSRFFRHPLIFSSIKKSGQKCKLFFMQHFAPGSETKKHTFSAGKHLLRLNPYNPIYWLRASLYPLIKLPRKINIKKAYKGVYNQSDKIILLSEGYKNDYCKIAGITDNSKFEVIPNIFSLPANSDYSDEEKVERVLILSRMDEVQKRLSVALKIWKEIEKDTDLAHWQLDIVGSGHNSDIVKRQVKKLGLKRVTLHGWKPREEFLKRSSIIMMTSEYEGLPLSLLEAQAYGCVPIAFNSFASLKDVVEPYENGVVVEKFGDLDEYVRQLKDLMFNKDYRNELMKNSSLNVLNFSPEKIATQWLRILT